MKLQNIYFRLASFLVLLGNIPALHAETYHYNFTCITNASASNCATGVQQLFLDVSPSGNNVLFDFSNIGLGSSSITDIYFDDGVLLNLASIFNYSSGVSFSAGAAPANLPGGNLTDPPFNTSTPTENFSADSDPAVVPNGINPGEKLGLLYSLKSGKSFSDVINSLTLAGAEGGLRVGLHVQGFFNGGSESFVNNNTATSITVTPELSNAEMMLIGLIPVYLLQRKKAA